MSIKSTQTITREEAIRTLSSLIERAKTDPCITNEMLGDALDPFYTFDNFQVINNWEKSNG